MHPEALEIRGVSLHFGDQLFHGDCRLDMPVGIEYDVAHRVTEYRGALVLSPHDDSHGEHHRLVLHDLQFVRRDVDEDEPATEVLREPAPALEIEPELLHSVLGAHIELGAGRGGDNAVVVESVTTLESPHGDLQGWVERCSVRRPA